jgi:hypothetical protein
VAKPKNVRTEGLWAQGRVGLCGTKSFGWIFGPLFLWFVSFGGAKEMNKNNKKSMSVLSTKSTFR